MGATPPDVWYNPERPNEMIIIGEVGDLFSRVSPRSDKIIVDVRNGPPPRGWIKLNRPAPRDYIGLLDSNTYSQLVRLHEDLGLGGTELHRHASAVRKGVKAEDLVAGRTKQRVLTWASRLSPGELRLLLAMQLCVQDDLEGHPCDE